MFLGPEAHYPNLDAVNWFLEESWPKISKAHPEVKFQIISKWSEEFKKLHIDKPNIEFLGFVEDLSQAFDGAIMIVPLRIVSGMRMKILEGIVKGEQAIRDDRTMDMTQAKEKMSKWLK